MKTETNYNVLLTDFFCGDKADITKTFRVPKKIAAEWLLVNKTVITQGNVHYLAIKDLGLGVCEVGLRQKNKLNTYVVTSLLMNER